MARASCTPRSSAMQRPGHGDSDGLVTRGVRGRTSMPPAARALPALDPGSGLRRPGPALDLDQTDELQVRVDLGLRAVQRLATAANVTGIRGPRRRTTLPPAGRASGP